MVIRCDCGFAAAAESETELVAAAQAHAGDAHGVDLAPETILGLLARRESGPHRADKGENR